jgi:hypothetical protein
VASRLYHILERSSSWIIVGIYKIIKLYPTGGIVLPWYGSFTITMWRLAHYLRFERVSLHDHILQVAVTVVLVLLFFGLLKIFLDQQLPTNWRRWDEEW